MDATICDGEGGAERFGRVGMAISMDKRVEVMKEYGAVFYRNPDQVDELSRKL